MRSRLFVNTLTLTAETPQEERFLIEETIRRGGLELPCDPETEAMLRADTAAGVEVNGVASSENPMPEEAPLFRPVVFETPDGRRQV